MYFLCDHYQWAESVHLEYWSESLRLSAFLFQLVMRVTTAKTFITMEAVEEVNYVDDDDALTCVKSRARNVALSCAICNIPFKNQVATSIRKISFPFFQLYIFSKPIFYQTYFLCLWNLLDMAGDWQAISMQHSKTRAVGPPDYLVSKSSLHCRWIPSRHLSIQTSH